MSRITFHTVTDERIARIAASLTEADAEELRAATGLGRVSGLMNAVWVSTETSVAEIDGEPGAIFGIAAYPFKYPGVGFPWAFFTDALRAAPKELIRYSRKFLDAWRPYFTEFRGWVHGKHVAAQRYLEHLGFTINHDQPVEGLFQSTFKEFHQPCAARQQ